MTEEVLREKVSDAIENLSLRELVEVYNLYAEENNYEIIEDMDNFDDRLYGVEPMELVKKVFYGEFNPNDKYFWFDGYENLHSASRLEDMPVMVNELVDFVIDKMDTEDFPSDIEEIISEYNDELTDELEDEDEE